MTFLQKNTLVFMTLVMTWFTAAPVRAGNNPWPMFRHDLQHTGRTEYTGPAEPDVNWIFKALDGIASSPAIGPDGRVYIGSKDEHLYAFDDKETAYDLAWKFAAGTFFDGHLVDSSPAVGADGTIYVGTDPYGASGQSSPPVKPVFFAINPDGSLKWSFDMDDGVESSPAIGHDGTVYVGSYDGNLYAIEDRKDRGVLKWKFRTGGAIDGSPAVDGCEPIE